MMSMNSAPPSIAPICGDAAGATVGEASGGAVSGEVCDDCWASAEPATRIHTTTSTHHNCRPLLRIVGLPVTPWASETGPKPILFSSTDIVHPP